jgi:DNA polymerase-3 subunit gamma/tau
MQNFVVSARKYRPITFDTVVGQGHITTTLKNAIRTQHLAQAFLFCGPRGVGKTTCARILAKTINCENVQEDGEACGACKSCLSYQNNNSFNVHELDAASNNSVDDIRNLNEQVRVPPQYGTYKVYIIDEVHMLSTAAFNAFLKTLEEPPRYAIFILATTEKHKILPTILSRCQIFDFNRIKITDISSQLAKVANLEGIGFEEEGLRLIAQKADGGMRDALSMFDMISTFSPDRTVSYAQVITNLHILDSDYYFKITDYILEEKASEILLVFNEILQKGFDGHLFILGLANHFRDLLVSTDPTTISLLEASEEKVKTYLQQASKASPGFYLNLLNQAAQVDLNFKSSKNPRLLIELSLLKMVNLKSAISNAEAEKKKPELKDKAEVQQFRIPPPASVKEEFKFEKSAFKPVPNIKDLSKKGESVATDLGLEKQNTSIGLQKKELSLVGLSVAKEEYLLWVKNSQKFSVSAWKLAATEDIDGNTVYLGFSNELTLDTFVAEKPHINSFFNENYDRTPQFEVMVTELAKEQMRPYTNMDKFNFLAKKYPKLNEMRLKIGLEAN